MRTNEISCKISVRQNRNRLKTKTSENSAPDKYEYISLHVKFY